MSDTRSPKLSQISQVYGTILHTALSSDSSHKFQVSRPHFWPAGYKVGGFHYPLKI